MESLASDYRSNPGVPEAQEPRLAESGGIEPSGRSPTLRQSIKLLRHQDAGRNPRTELDHAGRGIVLSIDWHNSQRRWQTTMVHETNPELQEYFEMMERGLQEVGRIQFNLALAVPVEKLHSLVESTKTERLKRVAAGFRANIDRALDQLALPAFTIYWAKRAQLYECLSYFNNTGNPDPSRCGEISEELVEKCRDDALLMHWKWVKSHQDIGDSFPSAEIERSMQAIGGVIMHGSRARFGLLAILSSCVTIAWTAFESLAGDLWEEALNCHPVYLSQLKGRPKGKDPLKLNADCVHRYKYDLSNVMGTISRGRYKFSNISDAKTAYREAFAKDFPNLDALIPPRMEVVECVRNLLVHRAGIIDQDFLNRMKSQPDFKAMNPGEELVVTGSVTGVFLADTVNSGVALFQAVDDWIATH